MIFKEGIPIYRQIVKDLKSKIIQGEYQPGQRVESVRDLAMIYGVNPNTMQKTMVEMEALGLLHSQGANGRYLTEDVEKIQQLKQELYQQSVEMFVSQMKTAGFTIEEMIQMIRNYQKGEIHE